MLFPSVSSLLCRRCREDGRGSRLLSCSCAAVAGSVSDGRGGRSWLLGLRYGRFLVALMLVVGGEEMENKKEGKRGRENMGLGGGSPDSGG